MPVWMHSPSRRVRLSYALLRRRLTRRAADIRSLAAALCLSLVLNGAVLFAIETFMGTSPPPYQPEILIVELVEAPEPDRPDKEEKEPVQPPQQIEELTEALELLRRSVPTPSNTRPDDEDENQDEDENLQFEAVPSDQETGPLSPEIQNALTDILCADSEAATGNTADKIKQIEDCLNDRNGAARLAALAEAGGGDDGSGIVLFTYLRKQLGGFVANPRGLSQDSQQGVNGVMYTSNHALGNLGMGELPTEGNHPSPEPSWAWKEGIHFDRPHRRYIRYEMEDE